jgi:hypothetical protein
MEATSGIEPEYTVLQFWRTCTVLLRPSHNVLIFLSSI